MRGKKGLVRYMNTMTVEGSVKVVISKWKYTNEGYISIPEYIARNDSVLRLESGICNLHTIKYGDHGIIVRQRCLWTGSIQPVRVKLTPAEMYYSGNWGVKASIKFPISMCTPFGADYDGGEMTIFIVTYHNDISECKIFKW